MNWKHYLGTHPSKQRATTNARIKIQDTTSVPNIKNMKFLQKEENPSSDTLISKPTLKQGVLIPPKLIQKKNENAHLNNPTKDQKDRIKQAFQRCMGVANQPSFQHAQEAQTSPEPPVSSRQQKQGNNQSGGLLGQFLKPSAKKAMDVIQLSSDSSHSSRINLKNQHFQNYRHPPRTEFIQRDPYYIPPLNLAERVPFASPQKSENKQNKTGLRYQLPDKTFKQKVHSREFNNPPSRYILKSSNERNQTIQKPTPPLSTSYLRQNSQPKENKMNPWQLKFANNTSPTQFKPQAHLPFPKTQFYIHINLLTEEQIDAKVLQRQDSKKNDIIHLGQRSGRPLSPTPISSKYKISNSNHKYKQQRIDNYFNNDQKREQSFNKVVGSKEEKKDEIQPDLSRMAKRSWKYPKLHNPLAIQGQMPLKNLKCDEFLERRARKHGEPRDLGVLSLDEIVQQCFSKKVLSQEVYVEYVKRSTPQMPIRFVQLFLNGKTDEWDYEQLKITLFDHRRLAEVLVKTFPQDYVIYQPHALQKDVHDFLCNLYLLTATDYKAMLESIDAHSGVDIWQSFNIRFEKCFDKPLLILPYQPKQGVDKPSSKWLDSNGPDSRYTPAEMKLIKNYRATREKLKEGCQKEKESAYIDCGQDVDQWSSSSSDLSSELSPTFNLSKGYLTGRNNVKKPGKGRTRYNK